MTGPPWSLKQSRTWTGDMDEVHLAPRMIRRPLYVRCDLAPASSRVGLRDQGYLSWAHTPLYERLAGRWMGLPKAYLGMSAPGADPVKAGGGLQTAWCLPRRS